MFFFKKFRCKKVKWCFQSNKKPFFECQIKNLKDSQILPSAGSLNSSFWASALCLSCAASLSHRHTHTPDLSSPSRSQPCIFICFTHLLHPSCCFFLGKSKHNFFHPLRALRCFDKGLFSLYLCFYNVLCILNIKGLKMMHTSVFIKIKNGFWWNSKD